MPLIVSSSKSSQSSHRRSPSGSDDKTMNWGFDPWASSPSSVAAVTEHAHHPRLFQGDGSGMGLPMQKDSSSPVLTSSKSTNIARHRLRPSHSPAPSSGSSSRGSNVQRNSHCRNAHQSKFDIQMETKMRDSQDYHSGSRGRTQSSYPPEPITYRKSTCRREDFTVSNKSKRTNTRPIIPEVSQMTLRQILSIVFAAFWDRADLYTDVLALYNDTPTSRQLTLAFLRQGRLVLATPIESPDDMTLLSAGAGVLASGGVTGGESDGMSTVSVVRAGTPVSRKAKLKFQAVSLAYELLRDEDMRKAYDEWRKWNLRLPPPVLVEDTDHLEEEDDVDSFVPRHCPDTSRLPKHSLKYRDDVNVTSILRNSNRPSSMRKNQSEKERTKLPKDKQKVIRWNEEVEELTITEQLPPYDPLIDSEINKENSNSGHDTYSADPYGDSPEEWFGFVDHELPRYGSYMNPQRQRGGEDLRQRSSTRRVLFAQEAYADFGDEPRSTRVSRSRHQVARDFHSLSTRTLNDAEDPSGGVVFQGYNTDDSLMLILDGPESSQTSQKNFKVNLAGSTESRPWNQQRQDTEKQTSSSDGNNASECSSSRSPHSQSIQVPTNQNENPPNVNDGIQKRQCEKSVASHSHASYTPSLHSVDFTHSLGSVSHSIDYGNDCDVGRTFDLAKGFQASLSNYINAAVEDMKEGLKVMGKHWDDLELMGSGGEQKNFFFLDAGELDAMMSILKEEMEAIPNPFATATTCNAVPTQAPVGRKSESKGLFQSLFSNLKK